MLFSTRKWRWTSKERSNLKVDPNQVWLFGDIASTAHSVVDGCCHLNNKREYSKAPSAIQSLKKNARELMALDDSNNVSSLRLLFEDRDSCKPE